MALKTYDEMATAIQAYTQNSESSFVANIPNFIIATEDKIFGAIDMPSKWKGQSSKMTVLGKSEYELEAGVIDILSVRITETVVPPPVQPDPGVEFGPVRYLLQKDYDFLLEAYPGSSTAKTLGVPKYYAISDAKVADGSSPVEPTLDIRLGPIPALADHQMTITYYGKTSSDSLVNSTAGTWLTSSFPDVLLYGSLYQAYVYMKGSPDLLQTYESQFAQGMSIIQNIAENRLNQDDFRPRPVMAPPVPQG
jgi:hypothetical protein|tara:strand:- start:7002 stop:7754 length:753 start_codon:yes stop_codon:yes gene_type:complete